MSEYVVATIHPWNVEAFNRHAPALPGRWHLIGEPSGLSAEWLQDINPRFVFFPHWSWKVPAEVLGTVECVCFHMTDVPYGRGGSPLQNLIERGHRETVMSALRMVEDMDAGPVYAKAPLSLDGRAQDIYERAAELVYDMIADIVSREPEPVPQEGPVTVFQRRRPEQSVLPETENLQKIYDHVRMLDADGYPRAFADHGGVRLEFSHACWDGDDLTAQVRFVSRKPEDT